MRVALVHDYLNEYGGAERVLEALAELYPQAPIYTAFCKAGSPAQLRFKDRKIIESFAAGIPFFREKLHSPLRFLAPLIWESFDFSEFDVVISSSSWYITKGIRVPKNTLHISYIHTPPRYLYGYSTSVSYQKYWPVRLYAMIVNKSLRQFDFESAQKVNVLVANSKEVQKRIAKFWRKDSVVVYPPVTLTVRQLPDRSPLRRESQRPYYLTGGRLVGPKHFDLAIQAANELKVPLQIFGSGPQESFLRSIAGSTVTFLGKVDDTQLAALYEGAKAFIALATDEDFGITPVESMMCGTPVIAYKAAGYLETVVEGETGVFVEELSLRGVIGGIRKIEKGKWARLPARQGKEGIKKHVEKFSKERFLKEMKALVEKNYAV